MNQPKFKIGDEIIGSVAEPFKIDVIEINSCGIYYKDKTGSRVVAECNARPFVEAQKKKLYAYQVSGALGEIKTFFHELNDDLADTNHLARVPDYDIEYPEAK